MMFESFAFAQRLKFGLAGIFWFLLSAPDANWNVLSVKWLRDIAAPEHDQGQLTLN